MREGIHLFDFIRTRSILTMYHNHVESIGDFECSYLWSFKYREGITKGKCIISFSSNKRDEIITVIIVMSEMAVHACGPAPVEAWIMISILFSNIPSHTTW